MSLFSFKGGIHPPHKKSSTEKKDTISAEEPKVVYIPLSQHIGAPATAIVEAGDYVKVGQKIGEANGVVSSPVHSSVSGTVKGIEKVDILNATGECIVIENDMKNEISEEVKPKGELKDLSKEDILTIIKEAGIVGMGGAGFPTHVKLSPPPGKKIDVVILNGAECEPYLTADHRLMLENPNDIVFGLKALMKSLDVNRGYIGIENNKPDAIQSMKNAVKDESNIDIIELRTKYPQGAEKQLIYAVTKKYVPSGGLPLEAGAVVSNVATSKAVSDAIQTGMPLIQRICTVTGSGVKENKNILIKTGTLLSEVIEQCGGFTDDVSKVIWGGPMMGIAMKKIEIPSTKTTSGILCFNEADALIPEPTDCIKCSKCVEICPAFLQPVLLEAYKNKRDVDMTIKLHVTDCIECGSCSFICPAKRELLKSIRLAKKTAMKKLKGAK